MKLYYLVTLPNVHGVLFTEDIKDKLPQFIQPYIQYLSEDDILLTPSTMRWNFLKNEDVTNLSIRHQSLMTLIKMKEESSE